MSSAPANRRLTPEEYLALEREAEFKSEYFEGVIRAMAGASYRHSLILGNLFSEIKTKLRGGPCQAHANDLRVRVNPDGFYAYPDIVVVCGEPEFADNHFDTLLNPTLIVEVRLCSTEARDRGFKFSQYRKLTSLREYVLVSQDYLLIERYLRQGEQWLFSEASRVGDQLVFSSIDRKINLSDVYDGVDFLRVEEEAEPDARRVAKALMN